MIKRQHKLQLVAGTLRVHVEETDALVRVSITGARALGCELPKLARFMKPIFDQYDADRRPMEISGAHVNYTGRIVAVPGCGWLASTIGRGAA